MAFELYRTQDGKRLRCGYTTGTCAALAAKAAARALLTGTVPAEETVVTPKGPAVTVPIRALPPENGQIACAVQKDGGDDVDATSGAWIAAAVEKRPEGVAIDGGRGVGRVTKPGLDQPVGNAAINSTPRRMIAEAVAAVAADCGYTGGFAVTIFVPDGEELAKKAFNPMLGITGGISILGTGGIVEPRSLKALLDSLAVEVRVHGASGVKDLIMTPGNYGEHFLTKFPGLASMPQVKCANFIGDTLDLCGDNGIETVLLVGHLGKMVKVSGGIMDTHSRVADCRTELFAAHAALHGATQDQVRHILDAATSDACIEILDEAGLRKPVLDSITDAAQSHLTRRAAGRLRVGLVTYSNVYGLLTVSHTAKEILTDWGQSL